MMTPHSPSPAAEAGVTEVQPLCGFRFIDLPSSWGGPARTA
jgi:hypothetical protein